MTTQSSPWDTYPFRQTPTSSLSSTPAGGVQTKLGGTPVPLRDVTLSPGARNYAVGNTSSILGSRGSIPSIGPLGSISSRASIASVGSMSSVDSHSMHGSDTSVNNMWHNDDLPKGSVMGSSAMAPGTKGSAAIGASGILILTGLPHEVTVRECHYIFALASDFSSLEVSKNAVSGEVSVNAKFGSAHAAQQAAHMLERRSDLFGNELKTQVQSFSSQYVSHPNATRSIYSRPIYGDSYWSQPSTPISPSTGPELLNGTRRQSAISPTDVYPSTQLGQLSMNTSAPSGYVDSVYGGASSGSSPASANGPTAITSSIMSPHHINGGSSAPSPLSTPTSATIGMSAVGSGLPGTPTLSHSVPHSSSSSSVQLSPTQSNSHAHSSQQQPQQQHQSQQASQQQPQHQQPPQQHHHHHHHHNQHADSQKLPPPNPADQNPPCNTLYVGNLPPDTSEVELKDLFSQQRGYRRLCFRTKQNGPMCFVEFEDEVLAGKALSSLYGYTLSNSVKGGIRLSYSKNPLGVRSRPLRK